MADTQETIADIIAEKRRRADEIERDCAEKMKRGEMTSDQYARELVADIRKEADRLDAALRRERGDCAKLREALSDACYAMFNFLKTQYGGYEEMANALDKAKAALAAPPRNCDVGTAEELYGLYEKFCCSHYNCDGDDCTKCPLSQPTCKFAWAQMPYEEGGAK